MSSQALLSRIRPTAKLASEPMSTVRTHRQQADVQAVAEPVPEMLKVPVALGPDHSEAVERRLRRPEYSRRTRFRLRDRARSASCCTRASATRSASTTPSTAEAASMRTRRMR